MKIILVALSALILFSGCASLATRDVSRGSLAMGSYHGPYSGSWADLRMVVLCNPFGANTVVSPFLGLVDLPFSFLGDTFFCFADFMNWVCGTKGGGY